MRSRQEGSPGRRSEWFVPRFGPARFKTAVGLLFLPYTGMVLAFGIMGAMISPLIHWDRVVVLGVVYFLGLGVSAHALDAVGGGGIKPWGNAFTRKGLWVTALLSLSAAYALAIPYVILVVPLLGVIALLEGFFVFAYNLEWFGGRLHTDLWFAFSWGVLPVLAGYTMQTNRLSLESLLVGLSMGLLSIVEIKASRPYKALKARFSLLSREEQATALRYEAILKSISFGVISLGTGLMVWRIFGSCENFPR